MELIQNELRRNLHAVNLIYLEVLFYVKNIGDLAFCNSIISKQKSELYLLFSDMQTKW